MSPKKKLAKKLRREERRRQQGEPGQQAAVQPPLPPIDGGVRPYNKAINRPTSEQPTNQQFNKSDDKPKGMTKAECWMVGLTAIYVVCAGIQGGVMWGQMSKMEHQLSQATDTANKQLRAYVGIQKAVIQDAKTSSTPNGRIVMEIKNFGQTPARNVKITVSWKSVSIPEGEVFGKLPNDFDYPRFAAPKLQMGEGPASTTYYDPGQVGLNVDRLSDELKVFDPTFIKNRTVYFYGEIIYTDTYDDTHIREFCYVFNPSTTMEEGLMVTESHNGERQSK